ncbi:MAG: NAD(P)H-dependent oxidoreductase subunit E [Bdellovibrionaceae bacterium]|nr:NAD(P)H-dependent oxidoreductase subunit E [Pseudobdellovibrionaceae bacterium]
MFKLSDEGVAYVKKELERYETKRSAIIPCLYRVQSENGGWVSPESINYLSELMDLPVAWINEVFHFYTMFNKEPVGKLHVQVCNNITCCMLGARELTEHISKTFEMGIDELSKDGKITLSKVECLGSCDTAPMMQINDSYHENLTPESAVKIIKDMVHGN